MSSWLPTYRQRHDPEDWIKDGALDDKQPRPDTVSGPTSRSSSIASNSSQLKSFLHFKETPTSSPNARTQEPPPWNFWAWFNKYLYAIFGIAVLGSQVTFTLIISDFVDPVTLSPRSTRSPILSKEDVRFVIAMSWLFFMLTLGVAVITSLLFTSTDRGRLCYRFQNVGKAFGLVVTFLLNFLPIMAFLMLSIATAAYVPVAGRLGVGFIGVYGLAMFFTCTFGCLGGECLTEDRGG